MENLNEKINFLIRSLFAFILFLGFISSSYSQNRSISGKVLDDSKNPVPAAVVILNDSIVELSDEGGNYRFDSIPESSITLRCRHTGFQTFYEKVRFTKRQDSLIFNIQLKYRELTEVEIVEQSRTDNLQKLNSKDISSVPSATGDFVQATLGAQAGVAINNELSASYSVRGGSYDENLIYVNGIQVYRPFLVRAGQQEGLSFVNSSLVSNIRFSAGGFAARYGDKMSSVLDITYKKPQNFEGDFELGLMGSNLSLGNQSKNGKWTYIAGLRYRSNALLLGSLETKGEYQPRFWDGQVYITHKISDKTRLGFLGVYSNNRFRFVPQTRTTEFGGFSQALRFTVFFDGQEESVQQSATTALELSHQFNKDLLLQVTASNFYTNQQENMDIVGQYRLDETNRDFGSDDFGDVVRNLGVGGFLNHARNSIIGNVSTLQAKLSWQKGKHFIRTGVTGSYEVFDEVWKEYEYVDSADFALPRDPNTVNVFESIRAKNLLSTARLQLFAEDELSFKRANGDRYAFNAGVRGHYYQYTNQWVGGPRASVAYMPKVVKQKNDSTTINRDVTIRLSGGLYYQPPFYRELRGFEGTLIPDIQAQKSIHAVLSTEYGLFIWDRPFKLISEFYYKWYTDLIPYELENVRIRYYGNNDSKGFARGFDTKLHGEFIKGMESWISFGLLDTREDLLNDREVILLNAAGDTIRSFTFDKNPVDSIVNSPGFIPRPSDQRIRFGMFFRDEMPGFEDLTVQLNFLFGTGLPFGPPDFNRYKDIFRTKSYTRVDVGFSKEFVKNNAQQNFFSNFSSFTLSIELLNVLDTQNVVNNTWIRDVSGGYYGVPNYLTRRLVNIKIRGEF